MPTQMACAKRLMKPSAQFSNDRRKRSMADDVSALRQLFSALCALV